MTKENRNPVRQAQGEPPAAGTFQVVELLQAVLDGQQETNELLAQLVTQTKRESLPAPTAPPAPQGQGTAPPHHPPSTHVGDPTATVTTPPPALPQSPPPKTIKK